MRMDRDFLQKEFGGVAPRACIWVEDGISREEFKTFLLDQMGAIRGDLVVGLNDLAWRCAQRRKMPLSDGGGSNPDIVSKFLGVELIKYIFRKNPGRFSDIRNLHQTRGFWNGVYRSLQTMRQTAAHNAELEVHCELLGKSHHWLELNHEWSNLLDEKNLFDEPKLLHTAIEIVDLAGIGRGAQYLDLPPKLYRTWISSEPCEKYRTPLEARFVTALSRAIEFDNLDLNAFFPSPVRGDHSIRAVHFHSLDDALLSVGNACVLVPDDLDETQEWAIRKTLSRKGALADPRDPSKYRLDESMKQALIPLELVASRFERKWVERWVWTFRHEPEAHTMLDRVHRGGFMHDLDRLDFVRPWIKEVIEKLPSPSDRLTLEELLKAHHLVLSKFQQAPFEGIYQALERDFEKLQSWGSRDLIRGATKRAPVAFWLTKIKERLAQDAPPAENVRPVQGGIELYRLSQAPLKSFDEIYWLGFGRSVIEPRLKGDFWLMPFERERLANEFGLRGREVMKAEYLRQIRSWMRRGKSNVIALCSNGVTGPLDLGGQKAFLTYLLQSLSQARSIEKVDVAHLEDPWVHPEVAHRYRPFSVTKLSEEIRPDVVKSEVRASQWDTYTRCHFWFLAQSVWDASNLRESSDLIDPLAAGTILHEAIRIKLTEPELSLKQALETAFDENIERLDQSRTVEQGPRQFEFDRLLRILEIFYQEELVYRARSGATLYSVEGPELSLKISQTKLFGTPDRIDEWNGSLFVMDYKSGGDPPSLDKVLKYGYRLQVPFYAYAAHTAQATLGKDVVGLQYIMLNKSGDRKRGMFPKAGNLGKAPAAGSPPNDKKYLTQVGGASGSLYEGEAQVIWNQIGERLDESVKAYESGDFSPKPIGPENCNRCYAKSICGFHRAGLGEGESSSE